MQPEPLTNSTTTVTATELRFGHEHPLGSINARRTHRDEAVESLADRIEAKGLIQELVTTRHEGQLYVAAGNRRLAAIRLLIAEGRLPLLFPVRIVIRDEPFDELIETSLIENIERVPLHPVDQFETFAALNEGGMTPDRIAARFTLTVREVKQRLALGDLSPTIRTAWRDGVLTDEAAQSFTLGQDHDAQDKAFARLQRAGQLYRHAIAGALTGDAAMFAKEIELVGRDAYGKAGGRLIEDLFGAADFILDPEILTGLVEAHLDAAGAELVASEGWGWAMRADQAPASWQWPTIPVAAEFTNDEQDRLAQLRQDVADPAKTHAANAERAEIEFAAWMRGATPDLRVKAGVVVATGFGGQVQVRRGLIDPAVAAPDAGADGDSSPPADATPAPPTEQPAEVADGWPKEPGAVIDRQRDGRTAAMRSVIQGEPLIAMRLLAATMLAGDSAGSPIVVRVGDDRDLSAVAAMGAPVGGSLDQAIEFAESQSPDELIVLVAALTAASIDTGTAAQAYGWKGKAVTRRGIRATILAIDGHAFEPALRDTWDAAFYFENARKPHAVAAIREALGDAEARKWAGKKAAEVAAFAVQAVPATGWLPPLLRTPSYLIGQRDLEPDPADPPPAPAKPKRTRAKKGQADG